MHYKALLERGTFLISVISTLRCKPKPIWVNTALKRESGMLGKSMIFKTYRFFETSFYHKNRQQKG